MCLSEIWVPESYSSPFDNIYKRKLTCLFTKNANPLGAGGSGFIDLLLPLSLLSKSTITEVK